MIKNRSIIYKINNIILLILFVILPSGCQKKTQTFYWIPAEISHTALQNDSYNILWNKSDIYTQDGVTLGLATNGDKVYVLGSTNVKESSRLNAFDAITGSSVWESGPKTLHTVFANGEGLYIGESGIGGKVVKYDPDTGKALWSKNFWDSGGVQHLIVFDDKTQCLPVSG